jgi:hypothetical protein
MARVPLEGNWLALGGAILYFLEWVAIIGASPPGPFGSGTASSEVMRSYATHAGGAAIAEAWFAIVLIGRVLFIIGVRASVPRSRRTSPWFDLAVAAMAVSVALEVASYGVVAGTARMAANGAAQTTVMTLDNVAFWIDLVIFAPAGVSMVACSLAMRASRAYAAWTWWLGLVAGVAAMLAVLASATGDAPPTGLGSGLESVGALGMWVFMLVVGIKVLRAPAPAHESVIS